MAKKAKKQNEPAVHPAWQPTAAQAKSVAVLLQSKLPSKFVTATEIVKKCGAPQRDALRIAQQWSKDNAKKHEATVAEWRAKAAGGALPIDPAKSAAAGSPGSPSSSPLAAPATANQAGLPMGGAAAGAAMGAFLGPIGMAVGGALGWAAGQVMVTRAGKKTAGA